LKISESVKKIKPCFKEESIIFTDSVRTSVDNTELKYLEKEFKKALEGITIKNMGLYI